MKKSLSFILVCTVLAIANVIAQDVYEKRNVMNLGLGGLALGNVSLNYERTFTDSRAASITAGLLIPRKLPTFIYDILAEEINLEADNKLSGFFIMPEYRFYPSYKIAPEGFYIAPFLRFNNYALEISGDFDDVTADIKGKFTGFGGGVQFGMHWIIKERVSIDFYMAGLGLYYDNLSLRFEPDDPGSVDWDELSNDIEVDVTGIPVMGEKTEIEVKHGEYVDAKSSFLFPGFRCGVSIGIVF
jgi:hypothetical protein